MDIKTINSSLEYIEKHLHKRLTIEEIAHYVAYSDFHFARIFSDTVGMTISQYISRRKVLHILYETKQGTPMITAAYDYGYEDYSSFYKACKRVYGMSPKDCLSNLKLAEPRVFFIGKERYPMMTEQKLKTIIKAWSLNDDDLEPVYSENRLKRKDQFLIGDHRVIVTNNYHKILESKRIADALNENGIRTPNFLKNKDGDYYVSVDDQYVMIKEEFKDKIFSVDEIASSKQVRILLGQAIGKLHSILEKMPQIQEVKSSYDVCQSWAMPIVKELSVDDPLPELFYEDYQGFESLSKTIPYGIIHRNPHFQNIFFKEDEVVGFGDFYLTTQNMRIFDICYLATSILAKSGIKKELWLEQYHDLIEGYNSVIALTVDEKKAMPYMMYSIQMIMIAYFSTQDGYEDLAIKNYHLLLWLYKQFN